MQGGKFSQGLHTVGVIEVWGNPFRLLQKGEPDFPPKRNEGGEPFGAERRCGYRDGRPKKGDRLSAARKTDVPT